MSQRWTRRRFSGFLLRVQTAAEPVADVAAAACATPQGESIFVSAPDGLRLHVRCYCPSAAKRRDDSGVHDALPPPESGRVGEGVEVDGSTETLTPTRRASRVDLPLPGGGENLPVVCLPGLARTEADFAALAQRLAGGTAPRPVFALDYRGRGRSDYDKDWRNYDLAVELRDILAVLTALEIHRAVFVGTSRGGLLCMLLAAVRPGAMAGVVLNDIGPVIEPRGLLRIKGYVGKTPQPRHIEDGITILRRIHSAQFPALTDEEWRAWARRAWEETPNGLKARYDPRLARTLKPLDPEKPIPSLWPQFDALANMPLMLVRGSLSDLLSETTVAQMRARRPDLDYLEVLNQGHAPLLAEAETMERIEAFVARCEGGGN